jgi:predicted  nucleic acid-binding Zn-ribbon protein
MNPLATIQEAAARTATRRRWLSGWEGLWKGFIVGAALYTLALAVWKLVPISYDWVTGAGVLGLLCIPGGFFLGFHRKITVEEAARWLDQKQGLKERLSTALEFGGKAPSEEVVNSTWHQLVVADANAAAASVDPKALLPLRLPSRSRWVAATLAVAATLGFLPEFRTKAHVQDKKQAEVIKEVGTQLQAISKRTLTNRPPAMEPARKALEDLKELGTRLQSAKLTREEALKDISKATDQMKQDALNLAKNPVLRKMEQAARSPSGQNEQGKSAMQKQMDSLQKQMANRDATEDKAESLKRDMDKLKEAAKGLSGDNSAKAQEARKQVEQMAAQLASKAESMGMPMPDLDEAAKALSQAQVEQFLKNLDAASQDLDKMADLSRMMSQLQKQMEKTGKDLPEQLKNGQAEAAIASLQKMIEALKRGDPTPEQIKKLSDELSRSVKPAEPYGSAAEHLQKALSAAQKGGEANRKSAADSLAAAQKELKDLLDQLNDAQSMMASLENLKRAQMAVGNCQSWGQCKNPSISKKSGKSRRAGKGVGQWSDSTAWDQPEELSDLWDNSGVERPDMAGKGHTERDTTLPDTLSPTKIKGQMQPGGSMPSITLKGLSIKGDSKVAYTEAVAAAQSEAQAAINQEQVPKAYRGAVRDYFDDLKK